MVHANNDIFEGLKMMLVRVIFTGPDFRISRMTDFYSDGASDIHLGKSIGFLIKFGSLDHPEFGLVKPTPLWIITRVRFFKNFHYPHDAFIKGLKNDVRIVPVGVDPVYSCIPYCVLYSNVWVISEKLSICQISSLVARFDRSTINHCPPLIFAFQRPLTIHHVRGKTSECSSSEEDHRGDQGASELDSQLLVRLIEPDNYVPFQDLVTDAPFDCSESAMCLQAMDSSHVALVSLKMEVRAFRRSTHSMGLASGGREDMIC